MLNLATFCAPVLSQPQPSGQFISVLRDTRCGMRDKILKLEGIMREMGCEIDCPLDHRFAPGTYSRTIFMPKGSFVIGKIHRNGCINIITKGICRVWTEDGERVLGTGAIWVSEPGTKRVVFMYEDVIWTTVHQNPDNLTDLTLLEDQIILPGYDSIPILDTEATPVLTEAI